jgi:hypothetical protein
LLIASFYAFFWYSILGWFAIFGEARLTESCQAEKLDEIYFYLLAVSDPVTLAFA